MGVHKLAEGFKGASRHTPLRRLGGTPVAAEGNLDRTVVGSAMYRHAAQINMARSSLPSPAKDESSDSESEILAELDAKRRQLAEEITSFRAQKEKEFRTFERELRSKRRGGRSQLTGAQAARAAKATKGSSAIAAVSNVFVAKPVRPNGLSKGKPLSSDLPNLKSRLSALPSQPTAGVDKLTINGTTTPPIVGTPPLTRSLSRSPTILSITPPRKGGAKLLNKRDEDGTDFAGLFTPKYLPLLEARPATSLPPVPIASSHPKRALNVPVLPSTSLPSALRTASGSAMRKRKHVTFQLGDTTIVEPSSSYEELPSPEKQVSSERIDEAMKTTVSKATPVPATSDLGEQLVVPKSGGSVGFFDLDEELDGLDNPDDLDDLDDREIDYHEVNLSAY